MKHKEDQTMNTTLEMSRSTGLPSPYGKGAGVEGIEEESGKCMSNSNPQSPIPNPYFADSIVQTRDLCLYYGSKEALFDITMDFPRHQVTALIGPSGCGKSTLLRCLNRMNDLIDEVSITGSILLDVFDFSYGRNVYIWGCSLLAAASCEGC